MLGDTVGDGNLDADVCGDVHALLLAFRHRLGRLKGLALLLRHRHAHLLRHRLTVFPAWQKQWESIMCRHRRICCVLQKFSKKTS